MALTSRELVYRTLNFQNPPRAPRQLWTLPAAQWRYPEELKEMQRAFPADLRGVGGHYREKARTEGDQYRRGTYVDEWGCRFTNLQDGIIGEVRNPPVKNWATDVGNVHVPHEWLTVDVDAVKRECGETEKFVHMGEWPRPFERLQFVRGPADLYMDLLDPPPEMQAFLAEMHRFHLRLYEVWAKTDVDALVFMDDWGSQRDLLISPALWRQVFKPLYREYAQLAHAAGKKIFMHSDGQILAIYPDLIEIGVDAVNSQIFCIGIEKLREFAGRITFWGELDRQHLLPYGTPRDVAAAVAQVHAALWKAGGCIAQCEFGWGARPENVRAFLEAWNRVTVVG